MAKTEILGGKLFCDLESSPGYVWFRCADYGLDDNTTGQIGYHCIYWQDGHRRPTVTDEMRADVTALFAAYRAAEDRKEQDERRTRKAADAVLSSIPAEARAELARVNSDLRKHFSGLNEGGEGYVLQHTWTDRVGRQILARHGADLDAISRAMHVLEG